MERNSGFLQFRQDQAYHLLLVRHTCQKTFRAIHPVYGQPLYHGIIDHPLHSHYRLASHPVHAIYRVPRLPGCRFFRNDNLFYILQNPSRAFLSESLVWPLSATNWQTYTRHLSHPLFRAPIRPCPTRRVVAVSPQYAVCALGTRPRSLGSFRKSAHQQHSQGQPITGQIPIW